MEEFTEPEDWTFEPLRDLDRLLRCSICFEYFKAAVMMPNCAHNYCSLCIRKHLQVRQLCPMCSKPVMESQLRCNRLIDNLVNSFKSNRDGFMKLLANNKNGMTVGGVTVGRASSSPLHVPLPPTASGSILDLTDSELCEGLCSNLPSINASEGDPTPSPLKPAGRKRAGERAAPAKRKIYKREETAAVEEEGDVCDVDGDNDDDDRKHPSSSVVATASKAVVAAVDHPQVPDRFSLPTSEKIKTPSRKLSEEMIRVKGERNSVRECPTLDEDDIINMSPMSSATHTSGAESRVTATSESNVATPTSSNNVKVACPVCQVMVFQKFINSHLDKCLNQPTTPSSTGHTSSSSQLKRLPKLVFSVMNDKQLRKQLKEYHLPTQGKRDVLLKRIKEFTLLYNAECDALNPRTMKEVAQEVERAEKSKSGSSGVASRKPSTPSSSSSHSLSSSSAGHSLPPPPQSSRKSSESDIAEMRESYVKAHDDHFSKLIADVRARELKQRLSSTPNSASTPSNPSTPMTSDPSVASLPSTVSVSAQRERVRGEGAASVSPEISYSPVEGASRPRRSGGDDTMMSSREKPGSDDLEEDSQFVFATDSPPSPVFLGGGGSRRGLKGTTCTSIPESPVTDHKATPASRKRTSTRYKRNNSISLSALYREEEEGKEHTNRSFLISDQDPDFLPSGFSPYKAKKKAKRH